MRCFLFCLFVFLFCFVFFFQIEAPTIYIYTYIHTKDFYTAPCLKDHSAKIAKMMIRYKLHTPKNTETNAYSKCLLYDGFDIMVDATVTQACVLLKMVIMSTAHVQNARR